MWDFLSNFRDIRVCLKNLRNGFIAHLRRLISSASEKQGLKL